MATETKTFYPSAYDDSEYNYKSIESTSGPVGKGSANSSSACTFYVQTGSNKEAYAFWKFDLSAIPEEATIDSVTGAANISAAGVFSTSTVQLYSGSTAKGTAVAFRSGATSTTVYSLSPGSWTRAELQSCRIKIYAKRGTSYTSNNAYVSFWGADLTVTYTYQSQKFMLKLSGAYNDVARTFKKVSGIWVEQTELANVIEDGVRYQNGGEIVIPKPAAVTIVGTGNVTYCYAVINGTKYSEATSGVEVYTGDVITFGYFGLPQDGDLGYVAVDGTTLSESTSGVKTVDWVVPSGVQTINISFNFNSGDYSRITITTGGGSSANLISFTIAGTSYQAQEGMTWGEWVASSYSQSKWQVYDGNKIQDAQTNFGVVARDSSYTDSSIVKTTDTITANYAYVVIY